MAKDSDAHLCTNARCRHPVKKHGEEGCTECSCPEVNYDWRRDIKQPGVGLRGLLTQPR
jgi:hypothetical protein